MPATYLKVEHAGLLSLGEVLTGTLLVETVELYRTCNVSGCGYFCLLGFVTGSYLEELVVVGLLCEVLDVLGGFLEFGSLSDHFGGDSGFLGSGMRVCSCC